MVKFIIWNLKNSLASIKGQLSRPTLHRDHNLSFFVFLQKGFPGEIEIMIFYDLEQTDGLKFNFRFSKSLFYFIYGPW